MLCECDEESEQQVTECEEVGLVDRKAYLGVYPHGVRFAYPLASLILSLRLSSRFAPPPPTASAIQSNLVSA